VWAATDGGLYVYDKVRASGSLISDSRCFPDLRLRSLYVDSAGVLWCGSEQGFLTKYPVDGVKTVYSGYTAAGWDLADITSYGPYLFVGSSKGFSIFDTRTGRAIRNATKFGTFKSPQVNAVSVNKNRIHLGCQDGMAWLDISGDWTNRINFYEQSIWSVRATDSAITTLLLYNATIQGFSRPSVLIGDSLWYVGSDSTAVFCGARKAFQTPSEVLTLANDRGALWVGTSTDYFYRREPNDSLTRFAIPGLTFGIVNKIHTDRSGGAWLISSLHPPAADGWVPWNEGAMHFDGGQGWSLYNSNITPDFGLMSDSPNFWGLYVARDLTVWLGFSGGNVKRLDSGDPRWYLYFVSAVAQYGGTGEFRLLAQGETNPGWGRSDAFCEDSSGFFWISSWENDAGCLIAYQPQYLDPAGHFRRHIPAGSPYWLGNAVALTTDTAGIIFAGSTVPEWVGVPPKIHLLAFRNNLNPVQNDIIPVWYDASLNKVSDMVSTPDGKTWVVADGGLFWVRGSDGRPSLVRDETITEVLGCIEAESSNILWLGTTDGGLIRYEVEEKRKTAIDQSKGLVSNLVTDLSIDHDRGYLWVATRKGFSRYDLGHTAAPYTDNKQVVAYPNPFSLSNPQHTAVVFGHAAPKTKLTIRTVRGAIVKQLGASAQSDYAWSFTWTPDRNLTPGTYVYVADAGKKSSTGKLLILP
jgi:hypothetical protein